MATVMGFHTLGSALGTIVAIADLDSEALADITDVTTAATMAAITNDRFSFSQNSRASVKNVMGRIVGASIAAVFLAMANFCVVTVALAAPLPSDQLELDPTLASRQKAENTRAQKLVDRSRAEFSAVGGKELVERIISRSLDR